MFNHMRGDPPTAAASFIAVSGVTGCFSAKRLGKAINKIPQREPTGARA
jgi:hypothetical protein